MHFNCEITVENHFTLQKGFSMASRAFTPVFKIIRRTSQKSTSLTVTAFGPVGAKLLRFRVKISPVVSTETQKSLAPEGHREPVCSDPQQTLYPIDYDFQSPQDPKDQGNLDMSDAERFGGLHLKEFGKIEE